MLDYCTCDSCSCTSPDHRIHLCLPSTNLLVKLGNDPTDKKCVEVVQTSAGDEGSSGNGIFAITEIGAWGGGGGRPWSFLPPGGGITKIIVSSDGAVDSLSFVGRDGAQKLVFSGRFGGRGGTSREVTLEWPEEYLTAISGTVGDWGGFQVVRSLEFTTNHGRKHGRFGKADGTKFSISMKGSAIVGFHGRNGSLVDAIGIYITPISCIAK